MHVLYIAQHFSIPSFSGGSRPYQLARGLIEVGHEVTLVCGGGDKTGIKSPFVRGRREETVDAINIIQFDVAYSNSMNLYQRTFSFFKFIVGAVKVALFSKYDVIFCTSTPLTAGIPGIFARLFRGKTFIFEVRDLWPELPKALGLKNPLIIFGMSCLEWLSYHLANRLIGLAPGIVEGIKKKGIPSDRIILIPNGSDVESFKTKEFVSKGKFKAVFTGAHGRANGLDALVDVAKELKRRNNRGVEIHLYGDGSEKQRLRKRARLEKLDNLIFHDPIAKRYITQHLCEADIGLQVLANIPAFYNGTSPNKFFDYIAAGIPVLNNYPGWVGDIVKNYDCGYVVKPNDVKGFADTLEYAANNRLECFYKGKNARVLAETKFNRSVQSEQFVKWLENTD